MQLPMSVDNLTVKLKTFTQTGVLKINPKYPVPVFMAINRTQILE
jgi:hypothetical protein